MEYPVEPPQPAVPPRLRLRLWLGLLAFTALLYWFLNRIPENNRPWDSPPLGESAPDALIEGFHLVSTTAGRKQWELFAQSAKLYQNQKQAYADQIYVQYYRDGKVISTLTADKGIINTETNDTSAEGHVELITENGAKLETEKLNWDSKTEQIRSGVKVHIYKGMDDITAIGMVADAHLNNIRFVKDVRTRVRDTKEIENFEKKKKF